MKRWQSNRYLYKVQKIGMDINSSLWNIITRIMEFEDVIDSYLQKLEKRKIITRKTRKRFLEKVFKELYWEILLEGEATIEGLDYLKEEEEIMNNVIDELRSLYKEAEKIKEEKEEKLRQQVIFSPVIIYNVGYSQNGKKNKDTKRKKKPGRPKLLVEG